MKRIAHQASVESRSKRRKNDTPKHGDFGIIESVSLQNFMCHENLQFKFEPNINFIIGQNGSGKSAILTAIILALGGRSSTTGRFSNAKGFIKRDKKRAKIEIILKNGGLYPYKPEIYGDKIKVVREISQDGGGGYKLYSAGGNLVSSHKDELNNVLNAMDIQIDNPVSILTQENSKNFLQSKHGKTSKLYEFFYQGTGLYTLEKIYDKIRVQKEETSHELSKKKEIVPIMEKELKKLKRFLDNAARISDLQCELVWAGIIEMEKRLEIKEKEVAEKEKKLLIAKKEHENCKVMLTKKVDALKNFDEKREEGDVVMQRIRGTLADLKTKLQEFRATHRSLDGKLTLYNREGKKVFDDMTALENCINENELRSQNDIHKEKSQRQEKLGKLRNEISVLKSVIQRLNSERDKVMAKREELKSKQESTRAEASNCHYNKKRCREQLDRLTNALKNKVNMFGNQTENILQEIQRHANQFRKLPLGPIGIYLEVKDPNWSSAIEACIKPAMLRSFCCDNQQDSKILSTILRKYYNNKMPSIIVSPYTQTTYDVTPHKAQTPYPAVLDMLTIKHPVIANCLIDQVQIENIILIENRKAATYYMADKVPRNSPLQSAYLPNCDVIMLPYRYYSSESKTQNLLTSIRQEEIQTLERECQNADEEHKAKEYCLKGLEEQFNKSFDELKSLDHQIVDGSVVEKTLIRKMQELQFAEDPKDTYCLKEDLQQLQSEYEKKTAEINSCKQQVAELERTLQSIESEMAIQVEALKAEKKKYDDICGQISDCSHDKETLESGIKKYVQEIKGWEIQLNDLKGEVKTCKEAVEAAIKNAEEACPRNGEGKSSRIDTDRSPETLRRLLAETEKVIEQQSNCDRAELQKEYYKTLEKIKSAKCRLEKLENNLQFINKMHNVRRKNFQSICSKTQNVVQLAFVMCLRDHFDATLEFDSRAKTLDWSAQPKKNGPIAKSKGKGSSLSGGERSVVTVAFLLAMWDRIKSPFKILDEYDVFMDSNNRHLSNDLLIRQAENMPDSQFILLSPLDLPQISNSPLVKIHQMPPPTRLRETDT